MAASASDIRAGGAWYQIYGNDGLTPVLERAKAAAVRFGAFMRALPVIGGPLDGLAKRLAPVAHIAAGVGDAVRRAFAGATSAVDALGKRAGWLGAKLGAAGAAGVAAFKPAIDALSESGKLADTADAFGLTAEKASRLFGIMQSGGSDLRDATEGVVTFNERIDEALTGRGDEAAQLFRDMGKSADAFKGDTADKFFQLLDALRAVPDPAKRVGLLLKAVGEDTGKHLIPLLSMSADQVRELGDAFEQSGADLQASRETTRAYALAVAGLGRVWKEVATAIAPALTAVAQITQQVLKPVVAWVKENKALVAVSLAVAGGLVAVGTALVGIGLAATVTATAVGGLITLGELALSILGAVAGAILSPYTLAAAAVAGLTYVLLRYTETGQAVTNQIKDQAAALRDQLAPAFEKGKEAFGAFANAIQKGDFASAWKVVAAGANAAWTGLLAKLGKAWDDFVRPIEDGLDDVFGGLGDVLDAMWSDVKTAFGRIGDAFDQVLTAARQAWEGIKHGFRQAVAYVEGLWDRFGPAIMQAIEPIRPFIAGLVAPFVLAFKAIEAAWDGLDRNIMVTLTRLAKNIDEVWIRVTNGIGNLFRKLIRELILITARAVEKFGAITPGLDVKNALEALSTLYDQVGKDVNIEARVSASNDAFKKVEDGIRAKNEEAKRLRAAGDAETARRREAEAAADLERLNAAIGRANRLDFGAAAGGIGAGVLEAGRLPQLGPDLVPNVSTRGAFASSTLAQQLGTGDSRDRQAAWFEKLINAVEAGPAETAEQLAPLVGGRVTN